MNFIGRKAELLALKTLKSKRSSSLIVCKGRRRIGKSRLIREFSKEFKTYLSFQGLPPTPGQTNQHQIDNFMAQLSAQSRIPKVHVETWAQAFDLLGSTLQSSPTLILLDEVSWMGKHDLNFPGWLKNFWDKFQPTSNQLIVCLCGCVSTWIEENILNSTHFVGRISLTLSLRELSIIECAEFFKSFSKGISCIEKLKYLSITGGVPKYLEELNPRQTFEENINQLAFRKGGFLVTEFAALFNNSFEKEKQIYRDIVTTLENGPRTLSEVMADVTPVN